MRFSIAIFAPKDDHTSSYTSKQYFVVAGDSMLALAEVMRARDLEPNDADNDTVEAFMTLMQKYDEYVTVTTLPTEPCPACKTGTIYHGIAPRVRADDCRRCGGWGFV